jgi:hypothetical protein
MKEVDNDACNSSSSEDSDNEAADLSTMAPPSQLLTTSSQLGSSRLTLSQLTSSGPTKHEEGGKVVAAEGTKGGGIVAGGGGNNVWDDSAFDEWPSLAQTCRPQHHADVHADAGAGASTGGDNNQVWDDSAFDEWPSHAQTKRGNDDARLRDTNVADDTTENASPEGRPATIATVTIATATAALMEPDAQESFQTRARSRSDSIVSVNLDDIHGSPMGSLRRAASWRGLNDDGDDGGVGFGSVGLFTVPEYDDARTSSRSSTINSQSASPSFSMASPSPCTTEGEVLDDSVLIYAARDGVDGTSSQITPVHPLANENHVGIVGSSGGSGEGVGARDLPLVAAMAAMAAQTPLAAGARAASPEAQAPAPAQVTLGTPSQNNSSPASALSSVPTTRQALPINDVAAAPPGRRRRAEPTSTLTEVGRPLVLVDSTNFNGRVEPASTSTDARPLAFTDATNNHNHNHGLDLALVHGVARSQSEVEVGAAAIVPTANGVARSQSEVEVESAATVAVALTAADWNTSSPLHTAAQKGHVDVASLLLTLKAGGGSGGSEGTLEVQAVSHSASQDWSKLTPPQPPTSTGGDTFNSRPPPARPPDIAHADLVLPGVLQLPSPRATDQDDAAGTQPVSPPPGTSEVAIHTRAFETRLGMTPGLQPQLQLPDDVAASASVGTPLGDDSLVLSQLQPSSQPQEHQPPPPQLPLLQHPLQQMHPQEQQQPQPHPQQSGPQPLEQPGLQQPQLLTRSQPPSKATPQQEFQPSHQQHLPEMLQAESQPPLIQEQLTGTLPMDSQPQLLTRSQPPSKTTQQQEFQPRHQQQHMGMLPTDSQPLLLQDQSMQHSQPHHQHQLAGMLPTDSQPLVLHEPFSQEELTKGQNPVQHLQHDWHGPQDTAATAASASTPSTRGTAPDSVEAFAPGPSFLPSFTAGEPRAEAESELETQPRADMLTADGYEFGNICILIYIYIYIYIFVYLYLGYFYNGPPPPQKKSGNILTG